jgi:hypothetical protein
MTKPRAARREKTSRCNDMFTPMAGKTHFATASSIVDASTPPKRHRDSPNREVGRSSANREAAA